eukprot:591581_1
MFTDQTGNAYAKSALNGTFPLPAVILLSHKSFLLVTEKCRRHKSFDPFSHKSSINSTVQTTLHQKPRQNYKKQQKKTEHTRVNKKRNQYPQKRNMKKNYRMLYHHKNKEPEYKYILALATTGTKAMETHQTKVVRLIPKDGETAATQNSITFATTQFMNQSSYSVVILGAIHASHNGLNPPNRALIQHKPFSCLTMDYIITNPTVNVNESDEGEAMMH